MKYLKDYKKLFESKSSISVDDVIYFSYYYSYSSNKDSAEIFDNFMNKYSSKPSGGYWANQEPKIKDSLLIVSNNDSRREMISYAEKLISMMNQDPEMKIDFINTLNKIKSYYKGYISLLDIEDCLYSLIDENPKIEYDFFISSNDKNIDVNLDIRKDLCDKLENDGSLENLKKKFENILDVKADYTINRSKKMSNYLDNNVKYTLVK